MSYLVLARKWRPRNFAETVGQEHVLKALGNALESGRLHHAYLFAGTRGVGKTTIARILAKALNCDKGITADPCGECAACTEIDEGRFVDLIEVDAASKTKVDDTRELLDNVQYAPARGRFKVYLIDEVHMLSKSSFNALLKTLEEPPPHVKFLLATTDPQKLPVTVLSRCLQFNLKRLTPRLIRERLEFICREEGIEAESSALAMIARAADGSLRDSLSLLDQAIAFCGGNIQHGPVAEMLGTIDRQHIGRLLKLLAAGDAEGLMSAVAEIDEQFPDYARMLEDLARALQRIAMFQVVGAVDADDELDESELAEISGTISTEDVQLFYQTAILGRRDLPLAPDPRSGAEMTLLRMLAFQPGGQAAATPLAPKRVAAGVAPPTAELRPAVPQVPAQVTESSADLAAQIAEPPAAVWKDPDWPVLVDQLQLNGTLKLLARSCAYLARNGNTVQLGLDRRSESFLTRERQQALAGVLSDHFGESLTVEVSLQDEQLAGEIETPLQKEARQDDEKMEAARRSLDKDPNVRALRDMFGAEMKADSVRVIEPQTEQE